MELIQFLVSNATGVAVIVLTAGVVVKWTIRAFRERHDCEECPEGE
jgi:hypothetical protein